MAENIDNLVIEQLARGAAGKVDSRKPDRELLVRLSSIVEGKIRRFSPTTASRQVARDPKPCSRPVD